MSGCLRQEKTSTRSAGRTRVALWRRRQPNRQPSHRWGGRIEVLARSSPVDQRNRERPTPPRCGGTGTHRQLDPLQGTIPTFAAQSSGPPGGIRTHDPRFRRPMLYPLSYGRAGEPLLIVLRPARHAPLIGCSPALSMEAEVDRRRPARRSVQARYRCDGPCGSGMDDGAARFTAA